LGASYRGDRVGVSPSGQSVTGEKRVVLEMVIGFERAGADPILAYHAKDFERWLAEGQTLRPASSSNAPVFREGGPGRFCLAGLVGGVRVSD